MQDALLNLVDNLSGIDNKKPENKFVDTMRSMTDSLSQSINKISEIDREILQKNKFINNMRSMMTSLSLSINKISEIDNKISQIDKKETENKFTNNIRSMISLLSQSINEILEIDRKISYAALLEKFPNTYQLCNKDLNKFALLLRKGVYPYEYMDSWNKFNEPVPLVEDHYYSELNKEGITKEDLKHVIEKCIEKYELDLGRFLSAPGLAWKANLKKTNVKLELLTNNAMLLTFEKGIRGGMC